ncbi:hypothetical protein [Arthrobacter livingstonensis]|uniref:hypothetical protein n=1 Tax=Arthrobacter livingstonensis TaxID=670078 RepID=UPI0011B828D6|nr:hypothetical protein [Arthrobacter livingstonensis]
MLGILDPLAAGDAAASSSSFASLQPWIVLVIVGVVLVASFSRAANRRKRARNASPYATTPHPVQPGRPSQSGYSQPAVVRQPAGVPYVGTLLNGVPMKSYDAVQGHQTAGFANERMRAEAELKRQLDALDAARRAGQVTAEQYAVHREAIFKSF